MWTEEDDHFYTVPEQHDPQSLFVFTDSQGLSASMREEDLCKIPHYKKLLNIKQEEGHNNLHAKEDFHSI